MSASHCACVKEKRGRFLGIAIASTKHRKENKSELKYIRVKGFITFLLAGALIVVLVSFGAQGERGRAMGQAGALEDKYYFEMGLKSAIQRSASVGAREGEAAFIACSATGSCKQGLGQMVAHGVGARISQLAAHTEEKEGWKTRVWCGKTTEGGLEGLAVLQENAQQALLCEGCARAEEGCGHLVNVDLAGRTVSLGKRGAIWGEGFEVVGFGALKEGGEISFEAYFPPEIWIAYGGIE